MENKENIAETTNTISKTYKEVLKEYIAICEKPSDEGERVVLTKDQILGAEMFAEYLDGSNVLTNELTMLALMKAREVDREFILALIDVAGLDKAKEIAQKIHDGHYRHTQNESNDVPKVPEQAS